MFNKLRPANIKAKIAAVVKDEVDTKLSNMNVSNEPEKPTATTLSTDHNTKTVQRALKSAKEYTDNKMASNAKRDLNRALSYLPKCPENDQALLQTDCDNLTSVVQQLEADEAMKRALTQIERPLRYAKEALAKRNVNDVKRYVDQAKREATKLPSEYHAGPVAEIEALEQALTLAEDQAKAAATLRQLEREYKSVLDTIGRAGTSMSPESLQPYKDKLNKTIEKLPDSLKEEWETKADALGIPATPGTPAATPTPTVSKKEDPPTTSHVVRPPLQVKGSVNDEMNSGLLRMMERQVRTIESDLDRGQSDSASYNLDRLRQDIETKVPETFRTEWLEKVKALDHQCLEAMKKYKKDNVLDIARRMFIRCQDIVGDKWNRDAAIEKVDFEIERFERDILSKDEHLFSLEEVDELRAKYTEYREGAKRTVEAYRVEEATKYLDRLEEVLSEDSSSIDFQLATAKERASKEILDRVPASAVGRPGLEERLGNLSRRLKALEMLDEKDSIISDVNRMWEDCCSNEAHLGYEDEQGSDYEKWRASNQLGLPKTERAIGDANDFLQLECLKTALEAGWECDVATPVHKAKSLLDTAVSKYSEVVQRIVHGLDASDRPTDLATKLGYLRDYEINRINPSETPLPALVELNQLVTTKMEAIQAEISSADSRLESAKNSAVAKANEFWPRVLDSYECVELDATNARDNIDSWKGRVVRITGKSNRMGWDYKEHGNDLIIPIDGVPICAKFTASLKKSLENMEATLGMERSTQDFEEVLVELHGTCEKVQPINWNHTWKRWDYLPQMQGVAGKIVAYRSDPFAADDKSGLTSV